MTRFYLAILCLTILSFGCSRQLRPDDLPDLVSVTITVVQDDKPLEGATVGVLPVDPENLRWTAGAVTDASGVARPNVHGKYKGVAPGHYKIVVSKIETDIPPADPDRSKPSPPSKSFDLIDPKFGDADKVDDVEIAGGGKNNLTIDVGRAVRLPVPERR